MAGRGRARYSHSDSLLRLWQRGVPGAPLGPVCVSRRGSQRRLSPDSHQSRAVAAATSAATCFSGVTRWCHSVVVQGTTVSKVELFRHRYQYWRFLDSSQRISQTCAVLCCVPFRVGGVKSGMGNVSSPTYVPRATMSEKHGCMDT